MAEYKPYPSDVYYIYQTIQKNEMKPMEEAANILLKPIAGELTDLMSPSKHS